MIPKKQNDILALPKLASVRYENIFRVYTDAVNSKDFYYYNITNKIALPSQLDSTLLDTVKLDRKTAWTTLSYALYGTIYLWYLLAVLNKNTASKFYASAGETITFIKPELLPTIINVINE